MSARRDAERGLEQFRAADHERRRLLERLVHAQEEERQRIARDIHAEPVQVLVALALRLDMLAGTTDDPELLAALSEARRTARGDPREPAQPDVRAASPDARSRGARGCASRAARADAAGHGHGVCARERGNRAAFAGDERDRVPDRPGGAREHPQACERSARHRGSARRRACPGRADRRRRPRLRCPAGRARDTLAWYRCASAPRWPAAGSGSSRTTAGEPSSSSHFPRSPPHSVGAPHACPRGRRSCRGARSTCQCGRTRPLAAAGRPRVRLRGRARACDPRAARRRHCRVQAARRRTPARARVACELSEYPCRGVLGLRGPVGGLRDAAGGCDRVSGEGRGARPTSCARSSGPRPANRRSRSR